MQTAANDYGVRLNIGCGSNKIEDYINIDMNPEVGADEAWDITKGLPLPNKCAREILFFHTIEHIEEKYHDQILAEFWRLLIPNGLLLISYPEFEKCARNYLANVQGRKDFWKATIYGLQRYPGDFHVSLMNSNDLAEKLQNFGFIDIAFQPEKDEPYNTIMLAHAGQLQVTYEELLNQEVFSKVN